MSNEPTTHAEVLDMMVSEFDGVASVLDIAKAMSLPQTLIRRYLNDMVRGGWIEKVRPNDTPIRRYRATPAGRRAHEQGRDFI